MKLYSVTITNPETKQKSVLEFKGRDKLSATKIADAGTLSAQELLQYAFGTATDCQQNGLVDFYINGFDYRITVTHNDKGVVRKNLKQLTENGFETVAREKSVSTYLNNEAGCNLAKVIKNCFVDVNVFKRFCKDGNLEIFEDIKGLLAVISDADKTFLKNQQMTEDAISKVFKLAESELPAVTKDDIDNLNNRIKEKRKDAALLSKQLEDAHDTDKNNALSTDLLAQKQRMQLELSELLTKEEEIFRQRKRVESYAETRDILPQARLINQLKADVENAKKQRSQMQEEHEWQLSEFDSISKQLDEKQQQSDKLIALKSRLQVAIEENARISKLEKTNADLKDSLNQLSAQSDKLITKKVNLKNKLESIEQSINDIRDNIKEFSVPDFTIGDIVENVRTEAKIAEISAEVDRIQTEIAARESEISEKEMTISGQTRRLNSLMSLDSTVAPLKAKDSIVRVIDSKIDKLTLINDSLKQKQTNYTRALEDMSFKQLKVEQSAETLNTMLNRKQFAAEEEFKRQVLLAGARNDSMIETLPAELTDPEIEKLKGDIADRTLAKNDVIAKAAMLKGSLEEIERHIAINNAEIEGLRKEKTNINRKYLELVAQNRNEGTQQYLKSLETNSSTRFLMDVQEQVVKSDTELRTYKRDVEKLQGRLNELLGRLKYLSDAASTKTTADNLEYLTQTNDQLKHELGDIGDRLSMCYVEHKRISDELDELNYTDFRMQELLMETMQKIKVNEREISDGKEKISALAGGDLTEKLIETESELDEITGERNTLASYKKELDEKVFDGKIQLLQLDWIIQEKTTSLTNQLKAVEQLLTDNGTDENALSVAEGMTEEDLAVAQKEIEDFDHKKEKLQNTLDLTESVLVLLPKQKEIFDPKIVANQQSTLDALNVEINQMEEKFDYLMTVYLNSNSAKLRLAQATHELETLNSIKSVINQTQIAQVVLQDKIANIVKQANNYLQIMTQGKYTVTYTNNEMVIGDDKNNLVEIAEMENTYRLILFTSLLLAQPTTNGVKGDWLLPDDRLVCNHSQYFAALALLKDVDLPTIS